MSELYCDGVTCTKDAEFLIYPDWGHPGDGGAACAQCLGEVVWTTSSLPDQVTFWQVKPYVRG